MHIPRSQRGQNGTVIILINGFTLAGPGGYRRILAAPQQPSRAGRRADGWAAPSLVLLYLFVGFTERSEGRGVLMGLQESSSV